MSSQNKLIKINDIQAAALLEGVVKSPGARIGVLLVEEVKMFVEFYSFDYEEFVFF